MKTYLTVVAIIGIVIFPAAAGAGILNTTGAIQTIAAPSDIRTDVLESDSTVFAFAELQNVTLTTGIGVTVSLPGTSPAGPGDDNLSPAFIPLGTPISSYFLHCDAVGSPDPPVTYTGSITFDSDVLGLMFLNPRLNDSHAYPGLPGTLYSMTGALEINSTPAFDSITLSADRRTVSVNFRNANSPDDVRIVTAAVPEPGALMLALFGGVMLVLVLLRRRSAKATW
jgi:hypothetical protein